MISFRRVFPKVIVQCPVAGSQQGCGCLFEADYRLTAGLTGQTACKALGCPTGAPPRDDANSVSPLDEKTRRPDLRTLSLLRLAC